MSKNQTANVIIYGLAILGLIVLAPRLLALAGGVIALVITLVIWMFSGALAGRFLRGEGYGPVGDVGLGLIGGVVGTLIFSMLGLGWFAAIPIAGPILTGAVGGILFVYLIRLFDSSFAR